MLSLEKLFKQVKEKSYHRMDLGYSPSHVVNVEALWEGELSRTPNFEKPQTQFDCTPLMYT